MLIPRLWCYRGGGQVDLAAPVRFEIPANEKILRMLLVYLGLSCRAA